MPAVLCAHCAATMKLLCWDIGLSSPLCSWGLNVGTRPFTSYVLLPESVLAGPFLIFTWSAMPNFFSYPTPILTFVAFFIFASLVVWKDCLGAYLVPRQRWEHHYAEWLCLFLQCFSRIATVKLLCWDTGLQEAPFYTWEGCVLRPWHLHRMYCYRNHFLVGFHSFFATQWRLEKLFR